ncbi:MAG TPA: DUF1800 domain-containing protein [Vicinamibacterales bacterium]|nr:DUF1800 domain-containing protein [Vicinamibacterales bacterium]
MSSDPRVQHLLRRAGFGASAAEAAMFSERGFAATLEALVDFQRTPNDVDALIGQPGYAAVTPSAGGMEPFSPSTSINDARQRWLFRMVHTRRPLQEKMALFWHQHFATAYSKIANAVGGVTATQMMSATRAEHPAGLWSQLELFRDYALPNFRDLLFEVARDPAMLYWLDGRLNTRARPQENFAREVMELFTIGVGQFAESDVYAGARVFTGWNLQRIGELRDPLGFSQFFYNPAQHDTNAKTFSFPIYADGSKTIPARAASDGMQDGRDLLAALARHPQTGRRLARKLWSFFISEIRPPDEAFVARIANVYALADCHMAAVVRDVLASREFNARDAHFARFSWPVEFVARTLKEVGAGGFTLNSALGPLSNMGQQLFEPPDVAGWERGSAWFTTAAMLARMNFAATVTSRQRNDIAAAAAGNGPTPDALLSFYLDRLTPAPFEPDAYSSLLQYLRNGGTWIGNATQLRVKAPGLVHLIVGSSEYQLV